MNRKYIKDDSYESDEEDHKENENTIKQVLLLTPQENSSSTDYSKNKSSNSSKQSSSIHSNQNDSFRLISNFSSSSNELNFNLFCPFDQLQLNQSKAQLNQSQISKSKSSKKITQPYSYQTTIFNEAKGKNSIIYMETGKGKTYIAIMLIADLLNINLSKVGIQHQKSNSKKVIFLVCDSALVSQQINTIQINTELKVSSLQGKRGKKTKSDYKEFKELFKVTDVFVAIPDVLYKMLSIGFLKISDIDMLIFDECHHTNSNHTYNMIMNEFYFFYLIEKKEKLMSLPLIVGLTASPLKTKIEKDIEITAKKVMVQLCENLDAKMIIDPEMIITLDMNCYNEGNAYGSLSPYFEAFSHHEEDTVSNNKEYIEIQSHLANKLFKHIYLLIKKLFLMPFLEMALNTLDTDNKVANIKEEYSSFIDKKFYSNNFGNFSKILNANKSLYDLRNFSVLFMVFEKIQRNLFMIFESLDLCSIIKFFELYRNMYNSKKNTLKKRNDFNTITAFNNNDYNSNTSGYSNNNSINSDLLLMASFDTSLSDYGTNEINQLLEILDNTIKALQVIEQHKEYYYESDRLNKLINTIDDILIKNPDSKIIIFVANRIVAHFLEKILNDHFLISLNQKFSKINKKYKSISVIGINKRKTEDQSLFDPKNSLKDLNEKIQKFNSDEVNILIGTSTVEEGLDVQKCNVVIVFTELNTTKSYIQMKGRARKKNAMFLVFTDSKGKTISNINDFISLSKCMRKLFTKGISQEFKSIDYLNKKTLNSYYVYVPETESKVTLRNVVPIMNELLQQMNNSAMKIKSSKRTEEAKNKNSLGQSNFRCTLTISGGWFGQGKNIQSGFHSDKQSAESECDLILIRVMHDKGLLDDHFKLLKI